MPLNWRVWCVGVCLPMCGLLRILVDVLCWCVRPSNVRSRSGQPCSLCRAGDLRVLRPARPRFRFGLTRAPHESLTSGGYRRIHIRRRVAVLRDSSHFRGFRSAAAPTVAALGTLGSSARCSGSRPLSRSLRRRPRRLRGDTRRNASSVDTPPRLATCLTAHPTNRVVACRSVRHSTLRPLPHLPQGAFFFAAFALADVPSARLAAPRIPRSEAESPKASSMRGANLSRRLGRGASPRRPLPRGKSVAISSAP